MFRRKHRDIRIIYKVLKDSKSVTDAMAWMRRNYPEAFRKDGE